MRKGIILSAGRGSRLGQLTRIIPKGLLPVYDQPMIAYSLEVMKFLAICDVLIITNPKDLHRFTNLLGGGTNYGINLHYEIQESPKGPGEALLIAERFLDGAPSVLMFADNIFFDPMNFKEFKSIASEHKRGASFLGVYNNNPGAFGVAKLDQDNKLVDIIEKPNSHISNYVVPWLYFYDEHAPSYAKELSPSLRNELEITDLNKIYISDNQAKITLLPPDITWYDAGTYDSLLAASSFAKDVYHETNVVQLQMD